MGKNLSCTPMCIGGAGGGEGGGGGEPVEVAKWQGAGHSRADTSNGDVGQQGLVVLRLDESTAAQTVGPLVAAL